MAAPMGRSCEFCTSDSAAKYTCPRCNAPFCSSACYASAKHANCSEDFYKEWVQAHVKSSENRDEAKQQIVRILQKFKTEADETENNLEDSDDDEPTSDIGKRFAGINFQDEHLDVDAIWNRLTDKEKSEFNRLVDSGDAKKLLPIWKPWWIHKVPMKLIREVGTEGDESLESLEPLPKLRTPIPSLAELTKMAVPAPSVKLRYNVVNVLYAYAFVARFYNGEHHEFALEAVEAIMEISASVGKNATFENAEQAMLSATNQIQQTCDMPKEQSLALEVLEDVRHILQGPNVGDASLYTLKALSDLQNLVEQTRKTIKKDKESDFRSKLKLLEKKLDYYLSWTKDYHQDLMSINSELEMMQAILTANWTSFEEDHLQMKRIRAKTAVKIEHKIEEIN